MIRCISSVSVEGKLNAPTDENSDFEYKELILELIKYQHLKPTTPR